MLSLRTIAFLLPKEEKLIKTAEKWRSKVAGFEVTIAGRFSSDQ
jgi:hypothetical protein